MSPIDPSLAGEIACVDLETTGGHAARDRVIEVGIVLLSSGRVVEEYSALVNPGRRIPHAIQQFTGISDAMVATAPPFAELADQVLSRLEGRLFVAHNARFDYGFLRGEFRRLGTRFRAPVLCTVRLSRALTPDERGHNLDAVMRRHGLACEARHRALGDAKVLADFLAIARERWPAEHLASIVTKLCSATRLPPQLDPSLVDELPDGPGVYLFYGEHDALLYVGKTKNLALRVPAHFADPRARLELELSRLVQRVEWVETAGEFGALVAEARLVREKRPLLNRRLRANEEHWVIRLRDDTDRPLAAIETLDAAATPGDSYGMFRRRKDAERALEGLSRTHRLCAKWLGLEPGEGSCIGYQLGRCRGVCAGKELPALHAVRVRLALAGLKRRDWPFAGRIGIRERDWRGVEETHLFDRWCYLGVASGTTDLSEFDECPDQFDPDLYRILAGFLERPLSGAEILTLDRT
ncbi:MAG: exonuclease domain-containing protein [Steroidobacteraceae bacterium]